ncbi:3-keto-5-aminohexanoate cleavage protein [Alcaligenaceae bacterium]|nr:3-keto-5-aminohexanoate cleavage protein [Alcaligenaceae bacterium]
MPDTEKPLLIEARLNEWSLRERNPHVPWTPEEIADDAYACWQAGASIVHFHVRNPDGSPAHDVELYARVMRAIRERCDVLIHPTIAGVVTPDPAARIAPLARMCEDSSSCPDFAPLDMGSTNLDAYDAATRSFSTEQKTYVNSIATLRYLAGHVQRMGLKELMCAWTVPCLRTVDAFVHAGWIRDDPALVCVVLTEGGIQGGHPGTPEGLLSMLQFMPQRNIEWSVCCREGNLFNVAGLALERGGHLSIGLGDYAYAELGAPANAELVRRAAELGASFGRPAASVDQVRTLLGLTREPAPSTAN